MDLNKFSKLPIPVQDTHEWRAYLEFIETYFRNRNIERPVVVEIGVHGGNQKRFYEGLLGYEHIGIDIAEKYSKPDILGHSQAAETIETLKKRLDGRPINLLFIDGDHSYAGVSGDYKAYVPYVKNIIALHDIFYYPNSVAKFWNELIEAEKGKYKQDYPAYLHKTFLTFGTWHTATYRIGIGLIIFPFGMLAGEPD